MARRRKNRDHEDNPFEDDRDDHRPKRVRRETELRRRRWPYVLILFLVLIALLPNILGWTGLHQRAVNYALKDFNGSVTIDRVSLGWLQPVFLSGIKAVDAEGKELLTVDQIKTSQSLFGLINSHFRTNNFGDITVTNPTARLHLRPEGSNLEDALSSYLPPATQPEQKQPNQPKAPISLPKFNLKVDNGRALISSSTDELAWQIDAFNLLAQSLNEKSPLAIESQCSVTELQVGADGKTVPLSAGQFQLKTDIDPGSPALLMESLQLVLTADKLPVSLAGPLAQRFIGPARSTGLLSAQINSNIDLKQSALGVNVQSLSLSELMLVAPQLIGKDQFQIRNFNANGQLQLSPQMISSSNFEIQTDFGKLKSHGSFDVNQLSQLTSEGKLLNEPLDLQGEIDLAALVRMLPATFKLHEDLEVESGLVSFQANTKIEGDARRLIFYADAANLKGRRGNQNLVWQHPVKLGGSIRQVGQKLALENLDCQTDFLRLAGNATMQSGSFAVKGDLSRMLERVGQFVDLTGMDLAGAIDGTLGWQAAEGVSLTSNGPIPIQLGGQFKLDQPKIKLPDLPIWQPNQLLLKFSGTGVAQMDSANSATKFEIQSGGARVDIGDENATVVLASPIVSPFSAAMPIHVTCEANGKIASWLAHLRNFVDIGNLQADGQMTVKGNVAMQDNQLQFRQMAYRAESFALDGFGMKVRDPDVNGTIEGSYDLNRGEIRLVDATLISSAVAARAQNLRLAFADRLQADGGIGFRGDVNRLSQWFELSPNQDSVHWFGSAEGVVQFTSQEQVVESQLSAKLVDLIAAQQQPAIDPKDGQASLQWSELYRDPQVQLDSQLSIASDFNAVTMRHSSIKSSAVDLEVNGTISDLSNTLLMDLQGRWNPNWDKVQALLAAYSRNTISLAGSGTKPFSIRGPLLAKTTNIDDPSPWVPAQLEGSLSMGWDQGSFLEVPIGASEIIVDLKNSIGYVGTRGIPFSGGSIQMAPYADLRGQNPMLVMKPTRVIDNVALSKDTARKWLKYVAPLVADATSAQGNLTLDMESLQMPLLNPLNIDAMGTIQVANLVVGPGPLAEQLLGTVQQIRSLLKPEAGEREPKSWLQLSQQSIPFTIKDQKVHHENVTLIVKDIAITTSGSVGFDQSLQMLAEISIADDWIAGKAYLAGLKGQKLRIPIGGTVSRPVLDKRAIQGFSTELARGLTSGALNQAITDKLAPKATELQEKLNDRVSGELNKLQDRVGGKMGGVLGQLPNFGGQPNLSAAAGGVVPNGMLPGAQNPVATDGGGVEGTSGGTSPSPNGASAPGAANPLDGLGNSLEDELKKGIDDLFKRKQ